MSASIKAIVFDLGNVLIPWNPRRLYRKIFKSEEEMEWFLANICTTPWNNMQDAGRDPADAIAELLPRHPDRADLIKAYYGRWDEMLGDPPEANVALLKEIKEKGCRLFALTNWPTGKFPAARAKLPELGLFDGVVVSSEVKMMKPSPGIFKFLLSRYGLDPAVTLFIDDTPAHIAAARALGINAIRYESPEQLRRELKAYNLP